MCSSLECSKVLTMEGARMVEEVGELELRDELREGKLRSPEVSKIQDGGKDALAALI